MSVFITLRAFLIDETKSPKLNENIFEFLWLDNNFFSVDDLESLTFLACNEQWIVSPRSFDVDMKGDDEEINLRTFLLNLVYAFHEEYNDRSTIIFVPF